MKDIHKIKKQVESIYNDYKNTLDRYIEIYPTAMTEKELSDEVPEIFYTLKLKCQNYREELIEIRKDLEKYNSDNNLLSIENRKNLADINNQYNDINMKLNELNNSSLGAIESANNFDLINTITIIDTLLLTFAIIIMSLLYFRNNVN